uniref:poly(A)-specific ribonuclease n=1 Tax=Eptatretus burgeri TaxID=7764 RepID=A0A8C4R3B7_EPTBU
MPAATTEGAQRIREVWAFNLEDEMRKIRQVIRKYSYVAMDTEFPGVVARPIGEFRSTAEYQYQLLRCNVDLLKIIQLGLTFMDAQGEHPPGMSTWQFNFKFNLTCVCTSALLIILHICICLFVTILIISVLLYLACSAILVPFIIQEMLLLKFDMLVPLIKTGNSNINLGSLLTSTHLLHFTLACGISLLSLFTLILPSKASRWLFTFSFCHPHINNS